MMGAGDPEVARNFTAFSHFDSPTKPKNDNRKTNITAVVQHLTQDFLLDDLFVECR